MIRTLMKRLRLNCRCHYYGFLFMVLLITATACQAQIAEVPRAATAEALSSQNMETASEPVFLPAPTATGTASDRQSFDSPPTPALSVWINETSEEHRQGLSAMAADFNERTGIEVALQFIDPARLPELAHTAVISDTLPDIILHPLEYSVVWSKDGILDGEAADAIIDEIGRDTFDPGALELVEVDGVTAAVPSDGYHQLLLFRKDWFEENGLETPDSYDAISEGADRFFDPDNLTYGIVIPTESNLINTHRSFEHLALANGCQLIDDSGEVLLLEPACRQAMDFYYSTINQYSPPGVQTDTSARNAYLDGRTSIIMSGPSILTALVETNRLDQNTGIVTDISGRASGDSSAAFGNITYLGVTPAADKEAAAAFAKYWFNEGYQTWLNIESERKVPMRNGTSERPRFYIDAWGTSPVLQGESLTAIYGPAVVQQLRDGIGTSERWAFRQGQGELIGRLYEKLTFSTVLQEMLSGYFNTEKTLYEAYRRVIGLLPDYQHPIAPTPEA